MKPIWLKITPEEPLVLGSVRPDAQFLTTRTYIPGRLLRGAWAEWLKMQGAEDEDILAQVKELRIWNFYPAMNEGQLLYTLPLPLTAMTCKHEPGFRSAFRPDRQGHGVVDTLLPQLAYHLLREAGAQMTVPFALTCAQCDGRMELVEGFYGVYEAHGRVGYEQFRPRYHAQTKVALSRFRRASQFQMLYTVNALAPQAPAVITSNKKDKPKNKSVVFLGRVYGDPQAVQELRQALDHVAIGALHTRGYGRVRIEETNPPQWPGLKERVETFNRILTDLWQDLKRLAANSDELPEKPDGLYFSIDLLSPGVFVNHGLPELVPELRINGRALRPIWWATRPEMASGWSTAWGLPKPTNLAARMGSVYAYRWEGPLDELLPVLQTLEAEGLGLRRDEGFGEILVCHPFHQEVIEQ